MSPSNLNSAARLVLVAKNCGAKFLDDPDRFDRMFGRDSFAQMNGDVLDLVRGVVKSGGDRTIKCSVRHSQSA